MSTRCAPSRPSLEAENSVRSLKRRESDVRSLFAVEREVVGRSAQRLDGGQRWDRSRSTHRCASRQTRMTKTLQSLQSGVGLSILSARAPLSNGRRQWLRRPLEVPIERAAEAGFIQTIRSAKFDRPEMSVETCVCRPAMRPLRAKPPPHGKEEETSGGTLAPVGESLDLLQSAPSEGRRFGPILRSLRTSTSA